MRLGGTDHKSEALKKYYKEGISFPIGTVLSSQEFDTNCSGSCCLFPFASCVLPTTLAGLLR